MPDAQRLVVNHIILGNHGQYSPEPRTRLAADPISAFGRNSISRPCSPTAMIKRHGPTQQLSERNDGDPMCREDRKKPKKCSFSSGVYSDSAAMSSGSSNVHCYHGKQKALAYEPCRYHVQSNGIHSRTYRPRYYPRKILSIRFEGRYTQPATSSLGGTLRCQ